jgi:hypothetical protein
MYTDHIKYIYFKRKEKWSAQLGLRLGEVGLGRARHF